MKNIELKKQIQESIKRVKDYTINLILFHGDGCWHDEGTPIYNTLTVYDTTKDPLFNIELTQEDIMETEDNLKLLRTEQKKLFNYLKKHFNNIEMQETNV